MERSRIVVVGGGFAGVTCARRLERRLTAEEAEITLVTPYSYQVYLPLLPHISSGVLTTQSVAVSLRRVLRRTDIIPGGVVGVDTQAKVCVVRKITDEMVNVPYDRLVLAPGSITRTFDIPGLDEHARGMKTLAEAAYIRDHVIAQLDLASATTDEEERRSRLQFVVVGGGYAGTETAAHLQRLTTAACRERYPRLDPSLVRWHIVDIAPRLMPELGERLGHRALDLMRARGVEVSLEVSVDEVTADRVRLTDGRVLPCRTLIWTAGVAASPLVGTLGAETIKGRLVVTPELAVPNLDGVFSLGDAAAVPDLVQGQGAICPPTAQHAQRQGRTAADNVVASLRGRALEPYRHRDLGLVVDLGGADAVSKPLGIELTGLPAQAVARGYHLIALRTGVAKFRVGANWLLNAVAGDDFVRTGFLASTPARLQDFEYTDSYMSREKVREHTKTLVTRA
ncbi:NADH dehydrogenase [Wenjunlia vitaminophila]|uniref:NADH dehydrogenase n=1 Tax=Wenjunlia vitaminophila TaxID=76728 RepID=A0A0T6LV59_WENVI|nr:FAD-dependent oxidoreductase [Wenjunlia vitaminophila]KRV49979.1 NADH dehydrogenase [Wenjunlia vitaminophila]